MRDNVEISRWLLRVEGDQGKGKGNEILVRDETGRRKA